MGHPQSPVAVAALAPGRAELTVPALLAVAFLVVPIVEIAVLLRVQREIGLPETIGLLIAVSVLGAFLVRREGARAWRAFRAAMGEGRIPAREVADGVLVMMGGALLLTPGFVTDVVGVLLIAPPTRAVARRGLTGWFARRMVGGVVGPGRRPGPGPGGRRPGPGPAPGRPPSVPRVIEGELDDPPPPSPPGG